MSERRAIVVGGSISGLFAAVLLCRHGWRADVYERSAGALAGRGAGIVAQPELRTALAAAGIADVGPLGVPVETRIVLAQDGRELMRHDCPQTVTSWERIYKLLRAQLNEAHYHSSCEVTGIEQDAGRAVVHFRDGRSASGDLVIGADGSRSTVRQLLFPDARLEYAGYVAWRSLIDERALSPAAHARIFGKFAFGLPPGEQFLGYPVTGPGDDMTPGRLRYNVVWYRPVDEVDELKRLLTDAAGHVHALSIPPPLIRPEVRAELAEAAGRLLAPEYREVIALSPQSFLQPIFDLQSVRLACGRVAIIGDAAFVARPHVAAGIIKAADDVLSLTAALDQETSVDSAMKRFEAERVVVGNRIVKRAQALGAAYKARAQGSPSPPGERNAAYVRSVIEDTALMTFMSKQD